MFKEERKTVSRIRSYLESPPPRGRGVRVRAKFSGKSQLLTPTRSLRRRERKGLFG
jgi:hypothetical protein